MSTTSPLPACPIAHHHSSLPVSKETIDILSTEYSKATVIRREEFLTTKLEVEALAYLDHQYGSIRTLHFPHLLRVCYQISGPMVVGFDNTRSPGHILAVDPNELLANVPVWVEAPQDSEAVPAIFERDAVGPVFAEVMPNLRKSLHIPSPKTDAWSVEGDAICIAFLPLALPIFRGQKIVSGSLYNKDVRDSISNLSDLGKLWIEVIWEERDVSAALTEDGYEALWPKSRFPDNIGFTIHNELMTLDQATKDGYDEFIKSYHYPPQPPK